MRMDLLALLRAQPTQVYMAALLISIFNHFTIIISGKIMMLWLSPFGQGHTLDILPILLHATKGNTGLIATEAE